MNKAYYTGNIRCISIGTEIKRKMIFRRLIGAKLWRSLSVKAGNMDFI